MAKITDKIFLDFDSMANPPTIFAKQGDTERAVNITPTLNGLVMEIPQDSSSRLAILRPDGILCTSVSAVENDDGSLMFDFPRNSFNVSGIARADLSFVAGSKVLSSQVFYVMVEFSPTYNASGDDTSKNDIGLIDMEDLSELDANTKIYDMEVENNG